MASPIIQILPPLLHCLDPSSEIGQHPELSTLLVLEVRAYASGAEPRLGDHPVQEPRSSAGASAAALAASLSSCRQLATLMLGDGRNLCLDLSLHPAGSVQMLSCWEHFEGGPDTGAFWDASISC
ncbi:hypothetical protein PAXRUDRAFT_836313 [Paxillus rubicundulus Ve08.2h10]|uniref:Uncharacterized protein n=1 Tax=Paxillus rubicundulus Ve08.2h10 TaxID=930991 RepID=A0A0D0CCE3_9AGAM|nr:hypothetical protein PAXRUDRAFT_836313 [Paxillus rubicundulus Ve08.2h10]